MRRPFCHCHGEPMYPTANGYWTCAVRAREAKRRAYWKRNWDRGQHGGARPNSGPKPAPKLNHCWLPGEAVLEFVALRFHSLEAAQQYLRDEDGGRGQASVALYRLRTDPDWFRWIRLDTADLMLTRLGLVVSELDVEPVVCSSGRPKLMEA